MSPPWTAECSGTFPSESKNEIISSRVQPRDSPHYGEKIVDKFSVKQFKLIMGLFTNYVTFC